MCTYLVLDDKLGSDVLRRLFRWFRCDRRSLYDSERFTDTGADFDFVLWIENMNHFRMVHPNEKLSPALHCVQVQVGEVGINCAQTEVIRYGLYLSRFSQTAPSCTLVSISMECTVLDSLVIEWLFGVVEFAELFKSARRSDG